MLDPTGIPENFSRHDILVSNEGTMLLKCAAKHRANGHNAICIALGHLAIACKSCVWALSWRLPMPFFVMPFWKCFHDATVSDCLMPLFAKGSKCVVGKAAVVAMVVPHCNAVMRFKLFEGLLCADMNEKQWPCWHAPSFIIPVGGGIGACKKHLDVVVRGGAVIVLDCGLGNHV